MGVGHCLNLSFGEITEILNTFSLMIIKGKFKPCKISSIPESIKKKQGRILLNKIFASLYTQHQIWYKRGGYNAANLLIFRDNAENNSEIQQFEGNSLNLFF